MPDIILKDKVADLVREKAIQRGYDDPMIYLLDLLAADEDVFPDNQHIRESFKRGFKQALQGKVMDLDELKRRMSEDD